MAAGRADVRTLVRLWNSGEWVPAIVADLLDRMSAPSAVNVAELLHPQVAWGKLTADEQKAVTDGYELWLARKKLRKEYDDRWKKYAAEEAAA